MAFDHDKELTLKHRRAATMLLISLLAAALLAAPSSADEFRLPDQVDRWLAERSAGEVSALSVRDATDPAGDIAACEADIVGSSIDYSSTVTLRVTTGCYVDPNTNEQWVAEEAFAFWGIDADLNSDVEHIAFLGNNGSGGLTAGVLTWNGSTYAPACAATPFWNGDRVLGVSFPANCIGAPAEISYGALLTWANDTFDEWPNDTMSAPLPFGVQQGYWMIGRTGDTYAFGDAKHFGNTASPRDVVDLEPTPRGKGYWTVNSAGNVYSFGDAVYHGGGLGLPPEETVTSLSSTPDGGGYWLFTTAGRVFPFGNAVHRGDMAGIRLNGPVLDSISTPTGLGYYMVASDGGIFTFGDAAFRGSMGNVRLNAPVQSLVPDLDGDGYWLVASDGGIFAFNANFYGSMGDTKLNKPVTGMVGFGNGYLMVAEDGGIFTFGDAPFKGSLGATPPAQPIVSVAILNID